MVGADADPREPVRAGLLRGPAHLPEPPGRAAAAVREAYGARDEAGCRAELKALASEAGMLAMTTPLLVERRGDRRRRIAAELHVAAAGTRGRAKSGL